MKQLNQKGFGAVEGLLIFIIVGVLGFTGWYVWHANQTIKLPASNTLPTPAPTPKTTTTKYLVIKEWSVRFKLAPGYEDLNYSVLSFLPCNSSSCEIGFSTYSISKGKTHPDDCAAETGPLGFVTRAKPGTKINEAGQATSGTPIEKEPGYITTIGSFAYMLDGPAINSAKNPLGPQPGCTTQVAKDFEANLTTIGSTKSIKDIVKSLELTPKS